jgi:HSP20 family molecular chaperone IbpA
VVAEKKNGNIPVKFSPSDRDEEFSRIMDTYSEMTDPWVLSTLHLPMFPYWRDVAIRNPAVDLVDYGDKFSVTAELPGFSREDIEVTVNGFSIEIKAVHDLQEKGKSKNYVQRERLHSSFARIIQLPQEVTPSKAKAIFRNGLLEIDIPKIDPSREKFKKITIE